MNINSLAFWAWLFGWLGGIILLYGYFLVQTGRIDSMSKKYIILNVVGSGLLIANVAYHKAYPSVLVNLVWCIIGIYTLVILNKNEK